ncbi:hypothetical protein NPIL_336901 [Nephila pilipes]|uniref:Uncharacterized protein n=1 Tax=Nephila pilipes TaxID=299642 RepID=A0A8X6TP19_NEPPI|nr:hypothetical protein NPIL_336901 [Nephila pilipes]
MIRFVRFCKYPSIYYIYVCAKRIFKRTFNIQDMADDIIRSIGGSRNLGGSFKNYSEGFHRIAVPDRRDRFVFQLNPKRPEDPPSSNPSRKPPKEKKCSIL